MPCRLANSGTVASSRNASRAVLALNPGSNLLRDFVIFMLHPLRKSRTPNTLMTGPKFRVHFRRRYAQQQVVAATDNAKLTTRADGACHRDQDETALVKWVGRIGNRDRD